MRQKWDRFWVNTVESGICVAAVACHRNEAYNDNYFSVIFFLSVRGISFQQCRVFKLQKVRLDQNC